ncbi:hypothetical protein, partial [Leyella stercorea]|uniref:hypothetical protein n=1 Tax=Leyella stercorea TaxID=363265 RepID=UPI001C2B9F78
LCVYNKNLMRVSNYILFYPNIFSTKENGQTKEYLYSFAMNKKSYLERILIEIQDKDFIINAKVIIFFQLPTYIPNNKS